MIENGTLKQKNNRLDETLVKAIFYLNRESQATDCDKKCSKMQKNGILHCKTPFMELMTGFDP